MLVAIIQKSQKERTQPCIKCECRTTTDWDTLGQNWVKMGILLLHSLISTKYVASPPIGGSSHKKRMGIGVFDVLKVMCVFNIKTRTDYFE